LVSIKVAEGIARVEKFHEPKDEGKYPNAESPVRGPSLTVCPLE
jgi:hypothetical protein